jgi:ABC-type multidrug transport system ATPase subunit
MRVPSQSLVRHQALGRAAVFLEQGELAQAHPLLAFKELTLLGVFSRVGYMPQDVALFGEFNIKETLTYFARIFGMPEKKFKGIGTDPNLEGRTLLTFHTLDRLDFLTKFLEFPSMSRSLEMMSGGQQRRASLAVALLHEPELLILDEPTVRDV